MSRRHKPTLREQLTTETVLRREREDQLRRAEELLNRMLVKRRHRSYSKLALKELLFLRGVVHIKSSWELIDDTIRKFYLPVIEKSFKQTSQLVKAFKRV